MPYPKNKYRKGYTIYGMDTLLEHLRKGKWVYLRDKVLHPGFLIGMTLRTVDGFLTLHLISEAIDQQKEYYGERLKPYATLRR